MARAIVDETNARSTSRGGLDESERAKTTENVVGIEPAALDRARSEGRPEAAFVPTPVLFGSERAAVAQAVQAEVDQEPELILVPRVEEVRVCGIHASGGECEIVVA
jgi:hypothetical protein